MKGIKLISWLLPIALLGFTACGKVRELPTEKVITIYNSNLEETNKMGMLDTLYVQIAGLKPNELHTIEALDPDNNPIIQMTVMSDEDGVIPPSALWYDVGLRKDNNKPNIGGSLSLNAFYIHVTGTDTDYKEPFYIVYSTKNVGEQPKPVVFATYSGASYSNKWGVENAFDETGTTDASGNTGKTKVYVTATNITPSKVGANGVDIYVVPSKGGGNLWGNGEALTDKFVVRKLDVGVSDDGTTGYKKLNPTLVWNLGNPTTPLINPSENNNAYDIIIDVNQNGVFDLSEDVNSDGKIYRYIDGIDGQGVVGFIVANTPANEFFVNITDADGNKVDTINETGSTLYIAMDNVPYGSSPVLDLYEHGSITENAITYPLNFLNPMPANTTAPWTDGHYLPYVAATKFIDTTLPYSSLTPITIANDTISMYDLVVTIGNAKYTTTIKVLHPPTEIIMSDGTAPATYFDETGTTGGNTQVYVSTSNAGLAADAKVTVYVMPHRAEGWADGSDLSNFTVRSEKITPTNGNLATTLLWNLDAVPKLINPTSANNAYDVIVDANSNGIYDAGELINSSTSPSSPAFVVRDTSANDTIDLIYINIASGGKFTPDILNPVTNSYYSDWDYRDSFASDGLDTSYYVYESYGAGYGYGIKAVWNPYIKPPAYYYNSHWGFGGTDLVNSIYQGASVDVYIVDAKKTKGELNKGNLASIKLGQGNFADVAGGKKTVPVQTSCYNGAYLYNIWKPKFTVGQYYVIVDVNRNGKLDEGVDIIDAVNKDGKSMKDDSSIVGFTVN